MTECKCTKEAEFLRLQANDEKHFDLLYGKNPPPGIIQTLDRLSTSVDQLNDGMPELKDQIKILNEYKISETACKSSRSKNLKEAALWLGFFMTLAFSSLNYIDSHQSSDVKQNTVITDPATLEQAIREGKNIKMRGAEVTKEYEKNYQEGIKEMNK